MSSQPSVSDSHSAASLERRLREVVLKAIPKLQTREREIKNETVLFDLGIDSLDHAKILMTIEDEMGIEIEDEDINNLQSINDFTQYCIDRISSQS